MSLVFIGDIHQNWHHIEAGLAALPTPPRAAILLGDIECTEPLDRMAAPLLDRGVTVYWIHGNHEHDTGPEMWENLAAPERNPLTAAGALHSRVIAAALLAPPGVFFVCTEVSSMISFMRPWNERKESSSDCHLLVAPLTKGISINPEDKPHIE